jgi:hypothetical protein
VEQFGCRTVPALVTARRHPYPRVMESPVEVNFDSAGRRPAGWQVQQRVDMVVNRLLLTHRGRPEEDITQALTQSLRSMGVVPNRRQVAAYAAQIAELEPLPPRD